MAKQKLYIVQMVNLYKNENGHFFQYTDGYFPPYIFTSQKSAFDFINRLIREWTITGYRIEHEPENPQEKCKAFMVIHWSLIDGYEERKMIITLDCQYPM